MQTQTASLQPVIIESLTSFKAQLSHPDNYFIVLIKHDQSSAEALYLCECASEKFVLIQLASSAELPAVPESVTTDLSHLKNGRRNHRIDGFEWLCLDGLGGPPLVTLVRYITQGVPIWNSYTH